MLDTAVFLVLLLIPVFVLGGLIRFFRPSKRHYKRHDKRQERLDKHLLGLNDYLVGKHGFKQDVSNKRRLKRFYPDGTYTVVSWAKSDGSGRVKLEAYLSENPSDVASHEWQATKFNNRRHPTPLNCRPLDAFFG